MLTTYFLYEILLTDRGTAPITKNRDLLANHKTKGMIPIEKNIIVIDELGNEYEATYPKRAKGLVKNGRARFVSETTICLACPPNEHLEVNLMDDNKENIDNKSLEKVTIEYILKQIELIRTDSVYLEKAIEDMSSMDEIPLPDNCYNFSFVTKAEGWRDIVNARETTNQKMIEFYEKVYDDIKPKSTEGDIKQFIIELVQNTKPGTVPPDYNAILNKIK